MLVHFVNFLSFKVHSTNDVVDPTRFMNQVVENLFETIRCSRCPEVDSLLLINIVGVYFKILFIIKFFTIIHIYLLPVEKKCYKKNI